MFEDGNHRGNNLPYMKYIKRRKVFPSVFLAAPSVVVSVLRANRTRA